MSINATLCAVHGYRTRKIVHACLAERGVNLRVNFVVHGWWVFQHVCSCRENHRKSSTIDGHKCFQTRGTRHHQVPVGPTQLTAPIERFASCVDDDVVGSESAIRNGRRRCIAPHKRAAGAPETPQPSVLSPAAVAGVGGTALTSSQAARARDLRLHGIARHGGPCAHCELSGKGCTTHA